jgi:hypothetical protein
MCLEYLHSIVRMGINEYFVIGTTLTNLKCVTGEYEKKFLNNWRIFWIFPKFLLWGLHSLLFLVAERRIFGKKN